MAASILLLFIDERARRKCVCSPAPLWTHCGTSWGAVDGGAKCHSSSSYLPFLLLFSSSLLVLIAFISWIRMSCTHINETQTSLASWHYFLLSWFQYPSIAAETLHLCLSCNQLLLCIKPVGISQCQWCSKWSWHVTGDSDPVCSSADISFNIIYVGCHAVLCFYSNSGHTEFPFGSVVINLSLLISCIPQAFQQGGLKAESCIVDWMHSLSSEAITNQSP